MLVQRSKALKITTVHSLEEQSTSWLSKQLKHGQVQGIQSTGWNTDLDLDYTSQLD